MQVRTKQVLNTLRRAQTFLDGREYSAALGEVKPHVEALATLVARLEQHATEQNNRERSARAATDVKKSLALTLRQEYLRPITQVARRLFANDPAVRNAFMQPRGRDDEGLLQAAKGITERATEFQALFVSAGLAPDFVERLRAATSALREAMVSRGLEMGRRSAASAGLLEEMGRGRDLIRLIDLMLTPRLANQRDQLAEWRTITRVLRRGVGEVGGGGGTGEVAPVGGGEVKAA